MFRWLITRPLTQRPLRRPLVLEALEDRTVPALFSPATDYSVGLGPFDITSGDYDGDGDYDIATMDAGDSSRGIEAYVTVLLNTGSGGDFEPASGSPLFIGVDARSVTSGDFNNDGMDDIAAANYAGSPGDKARVFLATGGGAFAESSSNSVGGRPRQIEAADLNADGNVDIITANQISATLTVLLGNGDGTFTRDGDYSANLAGSVDLVRVLDFNGDGDLDIYTLGGSPGAANILLGDGTGGFGAATVLAGFRELAVGDFTGDGKQDLAVEYFDGSTSTLRILQGDGSGGYTPIAGASYARPGKDLTAADLDGDGDLDLASAFGGEDVVAVLLGNGDGTFTADANSPYAVGTNPRAMTARDFNGDGTTDFATGNGADSASVLLSANAPPTNIALSNSSMAENQPTGTTVGTFTTTDPDSGDTFTYTLVGGTGDTDNAAFTIAGGTLKTAAEFNFEVKSSYSIRVRSMDAGGLFVEKVFTISVTNVNEAPTITVPGAQIAYEDVDKAISGISVADVDSGSLTVTLAVDHGTLTLGTTTGLTVSGNGTGSVSLSGTIADLNAALATLLYRGGLNYVGSDTLNLNASDGSLSANSSVALAVKSAAQQATDLQAQVAALHAAGVLNSGQAESLKLILRDNNGDAGKVQAFLNEVAALLNATILTQAQADVLLGLGNILLLSVTRR